MSERMASREAEVPFPTRRAHEAAFSELLGNAYAAVLRVDGPVAFLYLGQTAPQPSKAFMPSLAVADPSEVLAALSNMVKIARGAGRILDVQVLALIEDLKAQLLEEPEGGE